MGDPRKHKRKYSKPSHPWQKERIEEEKKYMKEYGLKNKKEVWKASSLLRNFHGQAKKLITLKTKQSEKENLQLINRIRSMGLIKENIKVEDILSLKIEDILKRRLQTIVYGKKLAKTISQARQFITHGHIIVDGKIITVPSHIVSTKEENEILFSNKSALSSSDHPERKQEEKKKVKKE